MYEELLCQQPRSGHCYLRSSDPFSQLSRCVVYGDISCTIDILSCLCLMYFSSFACFAFSSFFLSSAYLASLTCSRCSAFFSKKTETSGDKGKGMQNSLDSVVI